jgi:hypothetical protein
MILGMKKHVMAYSEVNLDMILGAEKMAGGRNAISDILK